MPYASVKPTPISGGLCIFLPIGDVFVADMVFRGSCVHVGDIVLEVDLIPLDIIDLDVIMRMVWLARHHTSADCFHKEFVFQSPGQPEV